MTNSGAMETLENADQKKAVAEVWKVIFGLLDVISVLLLINQITNNLFVGSSCDSLSFTHTQHAHSRTQSLRLRNMIFVMFHAHACESESEIVRRSPFFLHVSYYAKARILNLSYFHFGCRFLPLYDFVLVYSHSHSFRHMLFVELQFVWQ